MPRAPLPRKSKNTPKQPADYTAIIQPAFQPVQAVGLKRKEEAAKEAAAKKAATPKRKLSAKERAGKPSYARMIAKALVALNERSGSSGTAIAQHVEANYATHLPDNFRIFLRRALKKAVEEGLLRHEGARYRLSTKGKYKLGIKRKKRTIKKKKSASKIAKKKKTTKKDNATKKRSASPKRTTTTTKKKKKSDSSEGKKKKKDTTAKSKKAKASASSKKSSGKSARGESSSSSKTAGGSKTTPSGFSFVWQYQEGSTWKPYDHNASDLVEKAYQDYLKNPGMCDVRAVKSGQWQYQVDFLNNKQTNIQHESHTVRSIRRVPL